MCAGERDAPPDPGAIIDINNTSILATPHRLQSRAEGINLRVPADCNFPRDLRRCENVYVPL